MSSIVIEDGSGDSYKAKVDSNKRIHTFSVNEGLLEEQLREGKSYYVSAGAVDWFDGTYSASEYVFFEFCNKTSGNLMVVSPQVWLSPAHTLSAYTEVADQYVRFNQWISGTSYLDSSGGDGINMNLNGVSSLELPDRDNGNSPARKADRADAVAVPAKTQETGYICGFRTSASQGKANMLPDNQGIILGPGMSWIVSCKPVQNSTPTNHIMGCRASIIDLAGVGE